MARFAAERVEAWESDVEGGAGGIDGNVRVRDSMVVYQDLCIFQKVEVFVAAVRRCQRRPSGETELFAASDRDEMTTIVASSRRTVG